MWMCQVGSELLGRARMEARGHQDTWEVCPWAPSAMWRIQVKRVKEVAEVRTAVKEGLSRDICRKGEGRGAGGPCSSKCKKLSCKGEYECPGQSQEQGGREWAPCTPPTA